MNDPSSSTTVDGVRSRRPRGSLRAAAAFAVACLVFLNCGRPAQGVERDGSPSDAPLIQAGLAKVDITPEEPVRLSGYGGRREPFTGVGAPIYVRALAVGSDSRGPTVLIAAELIGISREMRNRVARRVAESTGVDPTRLTIATTHTHNGPHLEGLLPNIFGEPIPDSHRRRIAAYSDRLVRLLEEAARTALENRRPSRLAWGEGSSTFAQNRRVIEDGTWTGFGINRDGPVDQDVPVLRVSDPDGSVRGVVVGYACHATTLLPEYNQIHGDWPGAAARMIEENYPEAVALVVIGAGGDANPQPRGGGIEDVRTNGRSIAREVERVLSGELRPIERAPRVRLREIRVPLASVPSRSELEEWAEGDDRRAFYARTVLDTLEVGHQIPADVPLPVQTWAFGSDLAMVFLGGEVLAGYALRLEEELAGDRLWVSAYANAVPCYIATREAIAEGGYEVTESMYSYGQPTRLAGRTEDMIVRTVVELLPESYR